MVAIVLAILFAGGNQQPNSDLADTKDGSNTTTGSDSHVHQPVDGKCTVCGEDSLKIAVGFVTYDDWSTVYERTIREMCQDYGWVCEIFVANGDPAVQIDQVNTIIAQNFDAMIIQAADRATLAPIVGQAADEGIIVIDHYNFPTEFGIDDKIYKILVDEKALGVFQAEEYVKVCGGRGNVAMIAGPEDSDVAATRINGVMEVLSQYPEITVVATDYCDWDAQKAQSAAENIIAQFPGLNTFLVQDDDMVSGVVNAVEAAGKEDQIVIISMDFAESSVPLLKEGKLLFTIAVPDASDFAYESMIHIAAVADGLTIEHEMYPSMEVITKENVDANLDRFDDI